MQICFASHNQNKVNELRKLVNSNIEILSLDDLGVIEEIPETGSTLKENAIIKARFVYKKYNIPCFADDTGLEVEALDGAPGVYSARYAGNPPSSERNIELLIRKLAGAANRSARFRTVIALIFQGKELFFEGVAEGRIGEEKFGEDGFGYDPVFYPTGFDRTFAEMSMEEKNAISHRGFAVGKLINFLNQA